MPPSRLTKSPLLQKLTGPAAARYGALPKIPLPCANVLQREWNADVAYCLQGQDLYRRDIVPVVPFVGRLREMCPGNFISWITTKAAPNYDQSLEIST
jgi:hypothetical protein